MMARLIGALLFAGVAAACIAGMYIAFPLRSTSTVFVLFLLAASVLRAQFVLLIVWVCLTNKSTMARILIVLLAAALVAVADTILIDSRISREALLFLYVHGFVLGSILGALLTHLVRRGLRLRRCIETQASSDSQLSVRALFGIVTASALVMMLANLLRAEMQRGVYPIFALAFLFVVALAKVASIWTVLWATLWRGEVAWRIALALGFVAVVEFLQWYVLAVDSSARELLTATALQTLPAALIAAALLAVRKRGYRLGWFELGPRQRIAARREELQSMLDQYAATGEIEWGEKSSP